MNTLMLPHVAGNYASTPDSVANSITSDIDMRIRLLMPSWTASNNMLASKIGASGNYSWSWMFAGGNLQLRLSPDGSTLVGANSTDTVGFVAGSTHWLRATWRDSDDRVQYFTSDDGVAWSQLGTDVTVAAAGLFNSTWPLEIGGEAGGSNPLGAHVYYFELRNGIAGTVVQSFDATAVTRVGTRNPSTVTAGGPWTINGSLWDWEDAVPLGSGGWGVGQVRMGTN